MSSVEFPSCVRSLVLHKEKKAKEKLRTCRDKSFHSTVDMSCIKFTQYRTNIDPSALIIRDNN